MSDVLMPQSIPCQFDTNNWAPCKNPSDNGWCTKHEKLECVSCGNKATRSCDAGLSLLCGQPLCKTCEHSKDGKHITHDAAEEIRQAKLAEEEARKASRTSPVRRMNEELNLPLNLFELLKGDWKSEGYELAKVYYIELDHGLMACYPAVFASDSKRMVYTDDLNLLKQV